MLVYLVMAGVDYVKVVEAMLSTKKSEIKALLLVSEGERIDKMFYIQDIWTHSFHSKKKLWF